jgi:hypothetical protein
MTSVDEQVLLSLGLTPTGSIPVHTPSTGTKAVPMPTYDVELHFVGFSGGAQTFPTMPVTGCDYSAQNIDGLFGRDALAQSRLWYSGPDASWMLSI